MTELESVTVRGCSRAHSARALRGLAAALSLHEPSPVSCFDVPAAVLVGGPVLANSALMAVLQISASLLLTLLAVALIARGLGDGRRGD